MEFGNNNDEKISETHDLATLLIGNALLFNGNKDLLKIRYLIMHFDQISIENTVAVPGTILPPLQVYVNNFH